MTNTDFLQNKTNILNITAHGELGGRERQLFDLLKVLKKDADINFYVLFTSPHGYFYEQSIGLCPNLVLTVPYRKFNPHYYCEMVRLFHNSDVIVFWGVNFLAFSLALFFKKKTIFVFQGMRFETKKKLEHIYYILKRRFFCGNHGITTLDKKVSLQKFKALNQNIYSINILSSLHRLIRRFLFHCFIRKIDLGVFCSFYLKYAYEKAYNVSSMRKTVIYNAVKYDDFKLSKNRFDVFSEFGLNQSTFLIGVTARIIYRKRLDRLITALSYLPKELKVHAVILGDGDKGLEEELLCLAKELGVLDRLTIPGSRRDIFSYIAALDVFVFTSEKEPFGISVLEPLYLKVPTIIFSDSGGPMEIIKHKYNGFVVNDVKELAALLLLLYDNNINVCEILEHGHQTVIERFSINIIADMYKQQFLLL